MRLSLLIIPFSLCIITLASIIASYLHPRITTLMGTPDYASSINKPSLKLIDQAFILSELNKYRISQNAPPLEESNSICQKSENGSFDSCQNCSHAALIKISAKTPQSAFIGALLNDSTTNEMISNPDISHQCVYIDEQFATIMVAKIQTKEPNSPQQDIPISTSVTPKNFSTEDLWQGLVDYRKAHQSKDLQYDELLCEYAQKRIADHKLLQENTPKEEYPIPEKYPLDGHDGFIKDADSGFAFDVTKKNVLAENLAYWPSVEYAHQVIEWGWDSSTEGHRETQLSNDYNKGCVVGENGFYVAIFSN